MELKKISTQASTELWNEINNLAAHEGKYVYTLINEAFADLIEKRKNATPRRDVMEHFAASLDEHASLYTKLAK